MGIMDKVYELRAKLLKDKDIDEEEYNVIPEGTPIAARPDVPDVGDADSAVGSNGS